MGEAMEPLKVEMAYEKDYLYKYFAESNKKSTGIGKAI